MLIKHLIKKLLKNRNKSYIRYIPLHYKNYDYIIKDEYTLICKSFILISLNHLIIIYGMIIIVVCFPENHYIFVCVICMFVIIQLQQIAL